MIERALRSDGLGGQDIELFDRREAFRLSLDHHLALLEHVHELDADQRALGCLKGLESEHRADDPLHGSVVPLDELVKVVPAS